MEIPGQISAEIKIRVLSQSPNNTWAHLLMGRILAQNNRQAQAIEELSRALTLNPNLCLLGDQIITGASVTRGGYVDEIGQAEPCLSRFYSAPSAFACKSTDPPRS